MAACRTALLGLAALLALQHSSSGADSPEYSASSHHRSNHTGHHNRQAYSHSPRNGTRRNQKNLVSGVSSPEQYISSDDGYVKSSSWRQDSYDRSSMDEIERGGAASFVGCGRSSSHIQRQDNYSHFNGSECQVREAVKNITIETIKEQILNKLGLTTAPTMKGRKLPKKSSIYHLIDMFDMQSDQADPAESTSSDDDDDYYAKTSMIFVIADTTKLRHGGGAGIDLDIQHFRLSDHTLRNKVADATMHVYVPATSRRVRVRLYRVMGNATEHQSLTILYSASSKFAEQREPGWVELDTRKLFVDWFKSPQSNLGVVIKLEDDLGTIIPYTVTSVEGDEESKDPYVKIHTIAGRKPRNKRTIGIDCHEGSFEKRCCRFPLTIDFHKFGWDWVLAPRSYDANYCSGECPFSFLPEYPHSYTTQLSTRNVLCCAPRKLSSISLLYFDPENNIVFSKIPAMVVDKCGCQ